MLTYALGGTSSEVRTEEGLNTGNSTLALLWNKVDVYLPFYKKKATVYQWPASFSRQGCVIR